MERATAFRWSGLESQTGRLVCGAKKVDRVAGNGRRSNGWEGGVDSLPTVIARRFPPRFAEPTAVCTRTVPTPPTSTVALGSPRGWKKDGSAESDHQTGAAGNCSNDAHVRGWTVNVDT